MQCFDCGKVGKKLNEYVDGRRTVYLCDLCKAEREWRENPDSLPVMPPPPKTFWEKLKDLFKFGK